MIDMESPDQIPTPAAGDHPTVAVLYPGEMGTAVASLLVARGINVVTALRHLSDRAARNCRRAGILILDGSADVVRRADVIISLVPPDAAQEVAAAYCAQADLAPPGAIYVDANSIRPELAATLGAQVTSAGRNFVDAAFNGLAENLTRSGTLYLSGQQAQPVAQLFEGALRVRILGHEPGRASAMKMLLSGLSKGVSALFTELALVAERRDMLEPTLAAFSEIYPGIAAVALRMLPTYPRHAARRAAEMRQVEQTARAAGIEPCVLAAVAQFHDALADLCLDANAAADPTARAVLQQLFQEEILSPHAAAPMAATVRAGS